MPLIEVKNLEKIYQNEDIITPALRGVTFNIEKGEFISIMGHSGSGKSTLLQMLGFLDRHTSGEYRFEGKTMDDYSKQEIARVRNEKMGFVFQAFNLLPKSSVMENVMLPLLYSNTPENIWRKRALEAIESVGLSHRKDHLPSQLSGGEKQRTAIARALINEPEVIFADEPTGNLDSKTGEQVMGLISSLQEKGRTIILITHEIYIADYAERVINIRDGKIISDEKVAHRNGNKT